MWVVHRIEKVSFVVRQSGRSSVQNWSQREKWIMSLRKSYWKVGTVTTWTWETKTIRTCLTRPSMSVATNRLMKSFTQFSDIISQIPPTWTDWKKYWTKWWKSISELIILDIESVFPHRLLHKKKRAFIWCHYYYSYLFFNLTFWDNLYES